MNGKKTGGRQRGTPNRRTQEAQEILAELNCDPLVGMAKIAQDEANSPELRGRMLAELAAYAYPKRKAVEVTNIEERETSGPTVMLAEVLTPEEARDLEARMREAQAKKAKAEADAAAQVRGEADSELTSLENVSPIQ